MQQQLVWLCHIDMLTTRGCAACSAFQNQLGCDRLQRVLVQGSPTLDTAALTWAALSCRDIKLDNMLVADDWLQQPPRRVLKLCDFGFAEQLPAGSNNVQHCKGTPPYMGEATCAGAADLCSAPAPVQGAAVTGWKPRAPSCLHSIPSVPQSCCGWHAVMKAQAARSAPGWLNTLASAG